MGLLRGKVHSLFPARGDIGLEQFQQVLLTQQHTRSSSRCCPYSNTPNQPLPHLTRFGTWLSLSLSL
jgi:hypothetical protein